MSGLTEQEIHDAEPEERRVTDAEIRVECARHKQESAEYLDHCEDSDLDPHDAQNLLSWLGY